MQEINPNDVAKKYNAIKNIWDENDAWHIWTKQNIDAFVRKSLIYIGSSKNHKILNAGSGGYSYDMEEDNILHVDIAASKISHLKNAIIADVQCIPVESGNFDLILCVGSVINYCDPILVIAEFERILQKGGYLILEFENSYTLELLGNPRFNKKAIIMNSFHNGKPEKIWFFSESYIKKLTAMAGFKVVLFKRAHIFSPLIYRICRNENIAARFAWLDKPLSFIPFIKKFSSNTMLLLFKER